MPAPHVISDRICIAEALHHLKPFRIGRSSFYGTPDRPGARWTLIEELDIREGRTLTMDRKRFNRWLRCLSGEPATRRSDRVNRLGLEDGHRPPAADAPQKELEALLEHLIAAAATDADFRAAITAALHRISPRQAMIEQVTRGPTHRP
jgi:hypothetical protein